MDGHLEDAVSVLVEDDPTAECLKCELDEHQKNRLGHVPVGEDQVNLRGNDGEMLEHKLGKMRQTLDEHTATCGSC